MSTIKRGRVLRDTSNGEGLVFVDGAQHAFRLEGMWRSEYAPKVNMTVDVEFDDTGKLVGLRAVSGGSVAGEQASQALDAASAAAKKAAAELKAKGLPALQEWAQKVGYAKLAAFVLLVAGWFWLPVITVKMGFLGNGSATFYDGLRTLNSGAVALGGGGGGAGFYGFLAFVALAAVWLPNVWKDARANYGLMLPLAFMVLVVVIAWLKANSQMSEAREAMDAFANDPQFRKMAEEMAAAARKEMWKAISFGFGLYVSVAAALYLAWLGFRASKTPAIAAQPA